MLAGFAPRMHGNKQHERIMMFFKMAGRYVLPPGPRGKVVKGFLFILFFYSKLFGAFDSLELGGGIKGHQIFQPPHECGFQQIGHSLCITLLTLDPMY